MKKNWSKFPCLEGFDDGVTFGPSSEIAPSYVLQIPTTDYGDVLFFGALQDLQEKCHREMTMPGGLDMPDYIKKPASLSPNLVDEAMTKKCANESQLMQLL